ncbi:MoaD/ThiS family protein [Methanoculleus thermophilus]|jgi:molybdopterin synthase sulfur carrier subunit|uniref:Molybdopterin synthase subunit MoaD n=1 Tax=Methanoculleus thermophilus TaxID=2200 RepID=A0A1G8ZD46_9EURY|nr:MoaD/ThiS family protein [Methanoculleus thermophilus]SDK12564.1 molybdopterin synthase subunit MoaD [Methanoculleus thermophilus]HQD26419.1 MoaD/ThiS family protein [Methanoculleus thermophilus]
MKVTLRFFARFGELLGKDRIVDAPENTSLADLVRDAASQNGEGYGLIFDGEGKFREYVILMRNGKRVSAAAAERTPLSEGDEVAVFPPVAGG